MQDRRPAVVLLVPTRNKALIFRNAFQSSPDAALIVQHERVVLANQAAAALYGELSPEALVGRAIEQLFEEDFRPALLERIWHLLAEGGTPPLTMERVLRSDGTSRTVEAAMALIGGEPGEPLLVLTMRDVTERLRVHARLALSAEQLRALTAHQGTMIEEERKRIAREIHDELGQQLTSAKLRLSALGHALGAGAAQQTCEEISASIDSSIRAVRRIATDLRPPLLDSVGLTAAVEWQMHSVQQQMGIRCVARRIEEVDAPAEAATALFRILQEALTNVGRHAGATEARVSLYFDGRNVVLEVADNGCGIAPETAAGSGSLGILGMRERAALLGGTLDIESVPGEGTLLRVRIPVP